jgi:hypothetical protein
MTYVTGNTDFPYAYCRNMFNSGDKIASAHPSTIETYNDLTIKALTIFNDSYTKVFVTMHYKNKLLFEGLYNAYEYLNPFNEWMKETVASNSDIYNFVVIPKRDGQEIENVKLKHQLYYKGWKFI